MHPTKFLSAASFAALAACSGAGNAPVGAGQPMPPASNALADGTTQGIVAPHRYQVTLFVRGDSNRYNPDPIVSQGKSFFVAYQNATQPDGTGGKSTIVQYNQYGIFVQSIKVRGRCDGMRWNPYTNLMWITVNEDANSSMYTWNPTSGDLQHYSFSSARHGGGYDDLAFTNGMAFIAASNPKLNHRGINKGPALVRVVLKGATAEVTPVLMGDAMATNINSGKTVHLNLTDPDSLSITPTGDVLLVSQGDSEIIFIHSAGEGSQTVSSLNVGTQLDDTVYATQRTGRLYVTDAKKNAIYLVRGRFKPGAIYTEAPGDSYVAAFVGTVDSSNGIVKPVITGFGSPTGLIFVPAGKN